MDVTRILSEIDAEITRLQEARSALVAIGGSGTVAAPAPRRRGRPKGSTNIAKTVTAKAAKTAAPARTTKRKRNLSPEGRKRIADAMKKRWEAHRAKKTK
ncbi:MAG: hypothetical protein PW792_11075 [Acidobacteriaceae bacterium]|nr:hypothetical protein [Acidobacteriaceae bacterium]